jgi:outer membrane protein OmpA-like peptidoglycan-associated protein/uncharacterized protein YegP (UPF0339 family)
MTTGHDNYLECADYKGNPDENGFNRFSKEDHFYFSFVDDGAVVLCSEGYLSESARDNGIESVKKNMELEERYAVLDLGEGKWALSLKAGNNKEIARSCEVNSADAAKAFLPSERAKAKAAKLAAMAASATVAKVSNEEDEYLICREYEEKYNKANVVDGIIGFKHENTGQYYFAWYNENGHVILRSEAYPNETARDNGIESVKKNREDKTKFSTIEARGAHYLILKAGNHKEIGRSCPKKTLAEAEGLLLPVAAEKIVEPVKVEEPKVAAEEAVAVAAVAAVVNEVKLEAPKEPIVDEVKYEAPKAAATETYAAAAPKVEPPKYAEPIIDEPSGGGFKWWWLLIPLLLLLAFMWWRGCAPFNKNVPDVTRTVADSTTTNDSSTSTVTQKDTFTNTDTVVLDSAALAAKAKWALLGDLIEVKLADGTTIKVPANGDEKKLIDFLNGGFNGDLKKNWFNMDRVLFKTGNAELNEVSRDQLNNMIAIFKAYPNATFKIGGYTDNVGSVASNKKLSGARATTAMNEIVKGGIANTRLEAEGYGPENPICTTDDSEECRAKNRRIALRVTKCN